MTDYPTEISVTTPVSDAIERVKWTLFRPFDLGKWFVIGFCAWLAQLGESGGGFNGNFGSGRGGSRGSTHVIREGMDDAMRFVTQNLNWIIPTALAFLIAIIAWGILLTWLNSRGRFMFLHCVALNRAEVQRPWTEYSGEGNSLFWFRFVLGLIGMLLMLPLVGAILFIVGRMLYRETADQGGIILAAALVLVWIAIAICFALIHKFTKDFVVPIMYLRRTKCMSAWHEFYELLGANVWRFVLYILFQIVLALAIGFLVLAVVLVTCCLAGCVMALPYVGTVLLLPVFVFNRSYSLYYLAQFGPDYAVFPPPPAAPFAPPV
jgi:hypothetical protein